MGKVTCTDEFLQAYIECALWSSTDYSDDESEHLDENYGPKDLHPTTLAAMREDCEDFIRHNSLGEHPLSQAGHDFWLTRNRHGAGFWDRGLGEAGDRLTEAAHAYGESDLYVGDDEKLYVTP